MPRRTYMRRSSARRGSKAIATADPDDLLATANSYLGMAIHLDTYRLRRHWSQIAQARGLTPVPGFTRMRKAV